MSTSLDTLNEVNKYLAYVFVTILTLTLAFVLVKLRFKLDFAAYIISVTQVVQSIFRLQVFQTDLGVQWLPVIT